MMDTLKNEARLMIEARLRPAQGTRFQPTGFPDLGAAEYTLADGTRMLLVESAQSMANRLEAVCWDEGADDLVPALQGLPYVRSNVADGVTTTSIQEAHRVNSAYIVNSAEFSAIKDAIGFEANEPFNRRKLADALLRYDPNSLIHGVFLEKVAGVVRLPRALSGFIEASEVGVAASGGVKFDRIQPTSGESTQYGAAKDGYGNVPFHRDEYTGSITAYFSVDLSLIRSLGLGADGEELLVTLSLYKVRLLLRDGLRLRTACDLDLDGEPIATRPAGFVLPSIDDMERQLAALIARLGARFAQPRVTVVNYAKGLASKS